MSVAEDIAKIKLQEETLRFKSFNEDDAWALGSQMQQMAATRKLPLVIDIRLGDRQMFYVAQPGTVIDNGEWIRRKANSVKRFQKSTYCLNRETDASGKPFGAMLGIDTMHFANHGGGFPLHVIGTGVVGSITVSGIPQRDDHGFVVENLCKYLGHDHAALALGPESK